MTNTIDLKEVIPLQFEDAFKQVKILVAKKLSTSPRIVKEYTKHLLSAQGKYIRALSLLTCAMDSNNTIHPDAVVFASAIEILHLATLVHDDVMDNAEMRRGTQTLQKKYGTRTAVICGDYLFCVALETISECTESSNLKMTNYMSLVCLGELNQHINNGNFNLSFYQYIKIISGKTAALFEASFFYGNSISNDEEKSIQQYKLLGHYLGMIFQLTDDCNDFEVSKIVAKKSVQSDYEQGVFTLPLIYTLNNNPSFLEKIKSGLVSRSEINDMVSKVGGLTYTHKVAKKYHQKAMKIIETLSLTEEKQSRLVALFDEAYDWSS